QHGRNISRWCCAPCAAPPPWPGPPLPARANDAPPSQAQGQSDRPTASPSPAETGCCAESARAPDRPLPCTVPASPAPDLMADLWASSPAHLHPTQGHRRQMHHSCSVLLPHFIISRKSAKQHLPL